VSLEIQNMKLLSKFIAWFDKPPLEPQKNTHIKVEFDFNIENMPDPRFTTSDGVGFNKYCLPAKTTTRGYCASY
jgi:hypothetical protein